MTFEESMVKIVNRITEKVTRLSHPKTKTLSDLIIAHYKMKELAVEGGFAKIKEEDIEKQLLTFIKSIKEL